MQNKTTKRKPNNFPMLKICKSIFVKIDEHIILMKSPI